MNKNNQSQEFQDLRTHSGFFRQYLLDILLIFLFYYVITTRTISISLWVETPEIASGNFAKETLLKDAYPLTEEL